MWSVGGYRCISSTNYVSADDRNSDLILHATMIDNAAAADYDDDSSCFRVEASRCTHTRTVKGMQLL